MASFFIFDEEGEFYDVIKALSLDAARENLEASLKMGNFTYCIRNWRIVSRDELSPSDRLAVLRALGNNFER